MRRQRVADSLLRAHATRAVEYVAVIILVAGLMIFFGVHSVRMVAPGFRERQIAVSEGRWKGLYSLGSAAGIGLIVWGWTAFRPEAPDVFQPPAWARHTSWLLVAAAFVLLVAAYLPAGRIKAWVRHPMLAGVALWALAHLLANGDVASILLFGGFLAYAIVNRVAVGGRGDPTPVAGHPRNDIIAIVGGLGAFAVFGLVLHGWLFGVNPFA